MLLQLIVTAGPDVGRVFELTSGELLLVGRGKMCDIQLRDPRASKAHCRIYAAGGKARIIDTGSQWGTVVNEQQVSEHQLQPGDLITLGETELRFEVVSQPEATTLAPNESPILVQQSSKSFGRTQEDSKSVNSKPEIDIPSVPPQHSQPAARPPQQFAPASLNLEDLVGTKLLRYEIGQVVARARSGIVFRAVDTEQDRTVALKLLWPELAQQEEEVQRFLRAIKTMMPIKHENLIALYGAGKTGPHCFTASEFVEGESAAEVIKRIGIAGMLPWQHAYRVALHIARALEAAYEHRIVHRNITPQNILIRKSDQVAKLGDLMLAKALTGSLSEQITRPGELVGELAYMSPEQTTAQRPVDHQSDIYNLGATIYSLLTGRPPFDVSSPAQAILDIQTKQPEPPTKIHLSIPAIFEDVVLRMLAKRPADRYETPTHLVRDLERTAKYQEL